MAYCICVSELMARCGSEFLSLNHLKLTTTQGLGSMSAAIEQLC